MYKFIRIGNMYINPSELSFISMCKFNKTPENCTFYKSGTQCETCERVRYQIKGEGTWSGLDSRIKTSEDLERVIKESLTDEKYDPKVVDKFLNPPKGFIELELQYNNGSFKHLISIDEISSVEYQTGGVTFIKLKNGDGIQTNSQYEDIIDMIKEQS